MFNREANANVRWEHIKGSVRNETIIYATQKKHNDQKNEKDLIQEIYILEQKITTQAIIQEIYILEQNKNTSNNSNEHIHSLSNVRQTLDTLYDNKMNGILLRSKASHVENNGGKTVLILQTLRKNTLNGKRSNV